MFLGKFHLFATQTFILHLSLTVTFRLTFNSLQESDVDLALTCLEKYLKFS